MFSISAGWDTVCAAHGAAGKNPLIRPLRGHLPPKGEGFQSEIPYKASPFGGSCRRRRLMRGNRPPFAGRQSPPPTRTPRENCRAGLQARREASMPRQGFAAGASPRPTTRYHAFGHTVGGGVPDAPQTDSPLRAACMRPLLDGRKCSLSPQGGIWFARRMAPRAKSPRLLAGGSVYGGCFARRLFTARGCRTAGRGR